MIEYAVTSRCRAAALPCLDVAVAHKKMDVLVRFIDIDCEHDLIAVKKLLGERL